jgi:LysM repeat protein
MKSKQIALLAVLTGLLFATLGVFGQQAAAQSNLLTNPGFEGGYFNQDGIPEIAVPNGWRMHWLDGQPFNGSNGNAARPETVVWNIKDAPADEQTLFFKDGSYAFKIFKGWAPVYAALSQDVTGLEVGRKYRLAAPIFIDIVESYEGRKRPPTKLDSGQVRLGAGATGVGWRDEANIQYSGWWTAGNISPFYQAYPIFLHDFVATSPNMTVWVEMGSIDPYINNGFFVDGLSLTALDEVVPSVSSGAPSSAVPSSGGGAVVAVAGPTAPPAPTATPRADGAVVHVVQAGDSYWSLAIQYAATMGLTAEEALTAIPELNNNPAFINPGDELIIVPPGAAAAPEPEVTPTEEGAAESTEEPIEEPTAESEVATEPIDDAVAGSQTTNGVCVIVYEDKDGDAVYFIENENLLADAAVTLYQDGSSKASYVTDGINEPFCFENLATGTYQVQVYPPAGYQATTAESWAVAVAEGVIIPVAFGLAPAPQEVAAVSPTEETDAAAETAETASMEGETAVAEESGGGLGSISGLLLIGAAVVVLLAGVGVFLLRRG